MVAPFHVADPEIHRERREERPVLVCHVELEPVVPGHQRPLQQVADPAVGVGEGLGHPDRLVGEGAL